MSEYFDFIMAHWMLSSAFVVVLLLFLINEFRQRNVGGARVSPAEMVDLINHQGAVVIDVRSPEDYKAGHILGAHNVPLVDFESNKQSLNKWKGKPLIIVCEYGPYGPRIAKKLKKEGLEHVHYLAGGLSAWKAESLPLSSL